MFAEIEKIASSDAERPCVLFERTECSYRQMSESGEALARELRSADPGPFVLRAEGPFSVISGLVASYRSERSVALVAGCSTDAGIQSVGEQVGASAVASTSAAAAEPRWNVRGLTEGAPLEGPGSGVIIFTSGTSGPPKPVLHSWESLFSAIHRSPRVSRKSWLLAYGATRFAGLQVVAQALGTGGAIAVPSDPSPASVVALLARRQVDFASGTPSFWRMLIRNSSAEDIRDVSLRQITLGGEVVDQSVLDELKSCFPGAQITQVYASTEMGACFSVHDGLEGFPATFVEEGLQSSRLRVSPEGELLIQSARSMVGYLRADRDEGEWFPSGDLVERRGDRYIFVGRKSDSINVGGRKVFPLEVENVIRAVDDVADVCVAGLPSSILGEVVGAEVVLRDGVDREQATQAIRDRCQAQLPKYKVPASLQFVDELPISDGGKRMRGVEAEI
jgi:acyl-CoA synthetase (AMP-forming)/AMP-acid ligase II